MLLTIRKAGPNDARLLAQLNAAVQQPHHEAEPAVYKPVMPDDPAVQAWFRERLVQDECTIFIAESDGEPAGYVVCIVQARAEGPFTYAILRLHVDQLAVNQTHHRSGIGTALMNAAVELAKAEQVAQITLGVKIYNEGAIAFYQRIGFYADTMTMKYNIE